MTNGWWRHGYPLGAQRIAGLPHPNSNERHWRTQAEDRLSLQGSNICAWKYWITKIREIKQINKTDTALHSLKSSQVRKRRWSNNGSSGSLRVFSSSILRTSSFQVISWHNMTARVIATPFIFLKRQQVWTQSIPSYRVLSEDLPQNIFFTPSWLGASSNQHDCQIFQLSILPC